MNGIFALLVVALCVLGSAVICMSIIMHSSKDNSRAAQRRHDAEYAPVRDVYVVLQTTYNVTHNYDDRQVHIYGQEPTLGPGRIEGTHGHARQSLPRQRQAHRLPG